LLPQSISSLTYEDLGSCELWKSL